MNVVRYLRRSALPGPWRLENVAGRDFSAAVVIPALAESASFPETLAKLERNPSELLEKTLVVVVVNNSLDAAPAVVDDNRALLEWLRRYRGPVRLGVVDAASPGCELPLKEGVGTARKIGFDLVLPYVRPEGLLVSLDADTWVEPDYLPALYTHFVGKRGGVVIDFCHREGTTPELSAAIIHYELFLRGYVLGLCWAGSPYAVH
ncbi:MAG: glycosyltransferase, partial [Deltaproteobacteria bacterium]|nr:glycosyltransferase [Deltaproteobacteria bacterium]